MIAGTFDAQRAAFRLKIRSYGERISALQALEQALLDHRDGLVRAISDDFNGRAERRR
jgi:acyl-CoA reductase-like NAD-dependent aldehyde dehydrogenase